MELRHLRYFQAVAETLNFSRAAERLHIAQPPLSRQIKDLEVELGVQLFSRSARRVHLTEAGAHFQRETALLLQRLAGAVEATRQLAHKDKESLNIGTDWRLPMHTLAEAITELRARHPEARVNFVDLSTGDQLAALRQGRIDLAFIPELFIDRRAGLEVLRVERPAVLAALPAAHPLANRKIIHLKDLSSETWLLLESSMRPSFRQKLVQMCRKAGFTPKIGPSASSIDGLLTMVATGTGICLMLEAHVRPHHKRLRFVMTDCPTLDLCAVWKKGELPGLAREFATLLETGTQAARRPASQRVKRSM